MTYPHPHSHPHPLNMHNNISRLINIPNEYYLLIKCWKNEADGIWLSWRKKCFLSKYVSKNDVKPSWEWQILSQKRTKCHFEPIPSHGTVFQRSRTSFVSDLQTKTNQPHLPRIYFDIWGVMFEIQKIAFLYFDGCCDIACLRSSVWRFCSRHTNMMGHFS